MNYSMNAMYFSPTGTTEKIVSAIAGKLAGQEGFRTIDFTLPASRKEPAVLTNKDLVVVGIPVYAGRVPNVLLPYLNTLDGNGALAVAIVLYGNRNYDDALIELKDILTDHNFTVIAAGAFIGEHAFSHVLGASRPDQKDMQTALDFAEQIAAQLINGQEYGDLIVKGNRPYHKYYVPQTENGEDNKAFRKVTPKTSEDCTDCKTCEEVCPLGSIDYEDVKLLTGICIKCCACVKKCPNNAKYFDDPGFLFHKTQLETTYTDRREPELFI